MHALERRALDDPFLAEALEGSSQIPSEAFGEDMVALSGELNKAIHKRPAGEKPASMWTWPLRIAAGLVILISATVVFLALRFEKGNDKIALNEEVHSPVPEQAPPTADSGVVKNSPPLLSDASGPLKNKEEKKAPDVLPGVELQRAKKPTDAKDAPRTESPVSATISAADEVDAVTDDRPAERAQPEEQLATRSESEVSPSLQAPAPALSKSKAKVELDDKRAYTAKKRDDSDIEGKKESTGAAQNQSDKTFNFTTQTIKGQVFDATGTGLPGVNILIKGTNIGTITDATGTYEITPTGDDATLVYSSIGYSSHEVESAGKKEINISLDEDVSQLSEVVVTGYGVPKDDGDITIPLELASPEGGRRAYKQYLEKNLQYPERALGNKVEGKVTIQFAVEPNGQLTDFRVIKGIGDGCDEEVIRLIKSGPRWTPTKRDTEKLRGTVRVKMRFQLPKRK